ncbi:sacsin N-terminal ATP-binding-like domain-containing protein [Kurthia sp. Dielmo]|uniref:sacsin N-terminal ATP-binding-like domain-containing protein n=1 Tax=Kurthia sp. Dielmo TaxID=1033738 RepID=UPI00111D3183|nr:hypothetical protein [Kurthia sp. Dielmo]
MQNPAEFEAKLVALKEQFFKAKPGKEALGYLKTLREFESRVPGYMNSLKVLSDTTYEDRKHFLLELIQNADDAIYEENPTIHFRIYKNYFSISYNEIGFSMEDIFAITDTGGSTKTTSKLGANSFIGEKGIGFKSVFALAKEVHIYSGPWNFRLDTESYIVPTSLVGEGNANGTEIKVFFKDETSIEMIANELKKLLSVRLESFLFLQKLRHFTFSDCRKDKEAVYTLNIEKGPNSNLLILKATPSEIERKYLIYEDEIEFSPELVKSRWERLTADHPLKRTVKLAVLLDAHNLGINQGRLFCYLPTEITLPVPIFLQVDGHLKADRERLHDPEANEWNKYLLAQLPSFLQKAYLEVRLYPMLQNAFPDYIPVNKGDSQLAPVIQHFIELLKETEWIKSESNWVTPSRALQASNMWHQMFKLDPTLLEHAQKKVYRHFIKEVWQKTERWIHVWGTYGIREVNISEVASILEHKILDKKILKDDILLTQLYQKIYEQICHYSSWTIVKENLKRAVIFPIEHNGFKSISKLVNPEKCFWLSNRMRRNHGLHLIKEISIVDFNYTMQPSTTEEAEQKMIGKRNEALRLLLKTLQIEELNEDTVLRSIQIPYLVGKPVKWTSTIVKNRLQVLFTIFESYRAKKNTKDENYLKTLAELREMMVPVLENKLNKLSNVILPIKLQLKQGDDAYNNSGLKEFLLPEEWYSSGAKIEQSGERLTQYFIEIRDFLVACGIANSPQFFFKEKKYDTAADFRYYEPERFQSWTEKNKQDYTGRNTIVLQTVVLDQATKDLFKNEKATIEIEKRLYQAWQVNYLNQLGNIDSSTYYKPTPLGYLKTLYHRQRNEKELLLEDNLWGGLDRYYIPLTTIDGRLTRATKAYRLKNVRGLDQALNIWEIVQESSSQYHEFYLNSLKVSPLTINEVNDMWRQANADELDNLIAATYELLNTQIDLTELKIIDKNTGTLKSVFEFRLGAEINEQTPYIEKQYGSIGRLLGEKLQLQMDSEILPLLGSLEEFYLEESLLAEERNRIINHVFKQFEYLGKEDQVILLADQLNIKKSKKGLKQINYVINNTELYEHVLNQDFSVIHIQCDSQKASIYKTIANEFSFKNIEEYGKVSVKNSWPLTQEEKSLIIQLFHAQSDELEVNESMRLKRLMDSYGQVEEIIDMIHFTDEITKKIFEYEIESNLPLYDNREKIFYVQQDIPLFEIAAQWIAYLEFAPFKSTLRDYKFYYEEIKKHESKQAKDSKIKIAINEELEGVEGEDAIFDQGITPEKEIVRKNNSTTVNGAPVNDEQVVKKPVVEKTVHDIATLVSSALKRNTNNEIAATYEPWKMATDPGQHLASVSILKKQTTANLKIGPVKKEIRERAKKLKSNIRWVDNTSPDPKKYLLQEYGGRCQVCTTRLKVSPNQYYFEIFRLIEHKEGHAWHDQPFNILGLCPNCHALMKHGQDLDLTSIIEEAKAFLLQETAPQELEQYNGDFYEIPSVINGETNTIVISQQHLNYFAMLIDLEE